MKSEYFLLTVLDVMRDSTFELKFETGDERLKEVIDWRSIYVSFR